MCAPVDFDPDKLRKAFRLKVEENIECGTKKFLMNRGIFSINLLASPFYLQARKLPTLS
jgi:hypothetical protein